jgi:hypothetical protein
MFQKNNNWMISVLRNTIRGWRRTQSHLLSIWNNGVKYF